VAQGVGPEFKLQHRKKYKNVFQKGWGHVSSTHHPCQPAPSQGTYTGSRIQAGLVQCRSPRKEWCRWAKRSKMAASPVTALRAASANRTSSIPQLGNLRPSPGPQLLDRSVGPHLDGF
jgi:hypothetical protein